jgi:UDP-sugar transporter A1/2/3
MVSAMIRVGILGLLAVQNSGQTILIKIAQQTSAQPDPVIVMFLAEIVKTVISFLLFFLLEAESNMGWLVHFSPSALRRSLKLVPTALCFAVQNQLLFVAVHNLDPPVYQALSQLKILFAGIFSVLLLGKRLTSVQWVALLLLACGAALVQVESTMCSVSSAKATGDPGKGLLAVVVASTTSGLAGCYTELMLKTEKMPMWLQSGQVAFASAVILAGTMIWSGTNSAMNGRPNDLQFQLTGINALTWVIVSMVSIGGLIVVAVLRYADNVLKGISIVFALLLSGLFSSILLGTRLGSVFCIAAVIICCSVFLYQFSPPAPSAPAVREPASPKLQKSPGSRSGRARASSVERGTLGERIRPEERKGLKSGEDSP